MSIFGINCFQGNAKPIIFGNLLFKCVENMICVYVNFWYFFLELFTIAVPPETDCVILMEFGEHGLQR